MKIEHRSSVDIGEVELNDKKLLRRGSEILDSHSNVIVLYTQFELYERTLGEYIRSGAGGTREHMILSYQIVSGLYTIHCKYKLVHGNLSTTSIYIGCNNEVKIGDFGSATRSKLLIPLAPSPSSSPSKTALKNYFPSNEFQSYERTQEVKF